MRMPGINVGIDVGKDELAVAVLTSGESFIEVNDGGRHKDQADEDSKRAVRGRPYLKSPPGWRRGRSRTSR
jgi:hypothetical protein